MRVSLTHIGGMVESDAESSGGQSVSLREQVVDPNPSEPRVLVYPSTLPFITARLRLFYRRFPLSLSFLFVCRWRRFHRLLVYKKQQETQQLRGRMICNPSFNVPTIAN